MGISFGLGGQAGLLHILGSGLLKILFQMICSVFFGCFLVLVCASCSCLGGVVDSRPLLWQSGSKQVLQLGSNPV